ncbi:hypothetical protein [Streptomyces sp. NBC_00829]|nr:hypothetical protein OG293_36515 [Streptomyces sp. NBC_00829]
MPRLEATEVVIGHKLRRLADRGWLHRIPAGRFTALPQPPA